MKVMRTPGSTWATHSFGSISSTNTIGSGLRPLADADNVPDTASPPPPLPIDMPFSLASISFPQTLPELEFLLPVRRYDCRNLSETDADASDSASLVFCNNCCGVIIVAGPVHGLQPRYAPDAFSAISLIYQKNRNRSIP